MLDQHPPDGPCRSTLRDERVNSRLILLGRLFFDMSLEETVDYLAEELDLERSNHVREVGQSVAELRD